MIRPRTGDFLYSNTEMKVMLEDVRVFRDNGVHGVVVGVLHEDGNVDVERMKQSVTICRFWLLYSLCLRIVAAALPLEGNVVTF